MDAVIKKYYDTYRKRDKLPPEIEDKVVGKLYAGAELEDWRNNRRGVKYHDQKRKALLKGALDDCLVKGKTLIPLDYKTRGYPLKEDSTSFYQHQLDIYCYLLHQNDYKVADFAYLVYYYPEKVKKNGRMDFNVVVKKITTDIKNAERLFRDAVKCLRGPEPKRHSDCEYCSWGAETFGS